ncbi:hypothetical protein GMOD_00008200 [Pyrenophora seminiperda CCB06]|uniref:Uncharacterized protein n=1 Tax=Pyrenophora seminiperda CCB06 TaxID=1302712 RepID=A0A3M7M1X7_9PLEO|nr:hypothetical protein GMOD_00008200 [Pyrenophora seminiperda CCB06]
MDSNGDHIFDPFAEFMFGMVGLDETATASGSNQSQGNIDPALLALNAPSASNAPLASNSGITQPAPPTLPTVGGNAAGNVPALPPIALWSTSNLGSTRPTVGGNATAGGNAAQGYGNVPVQPAMTFWPTSNLGSTQPTPPTLPTVGGNAAVGANVAYGYGHAPANLPVAPLASSSFDSSSIPTPQLPALPTLVDSLIVRLRIPRAKVQEMYREEQKWMLQLKESQAKRIIQRQKNEQALAHRMGDNVTIEKRPTDIGVTIRGIFWMPPANDSTIPLTHAEQVTHVDALAVAIKNNQGCREQADRAAFQNRWADTSSFYSQEEVEAAAKEIVDAMIEIHLKGWRKAIFDRDERECYQTTMFYTFQDRFESLHELLMYSKTCCKDVMKGLKFWALIGNPRMFLQRTQVNMNSNNLKAVRIAKGTEKLAEEGAVIATQRKRKAGSHDETSPRPRKSQKTLPGSTATGAAAPTTVVATSTTGADNSTTGTISLTGTAPTTSMPSTGISFGYSNLTLTDTPSPTGTTSPTGPTTSTGAAFPTAFNNRVREENDDSDALEPGSGADNRRKKIAMKARNARRSSQQD